MSQDLLKELVEAADQGAHEYAFLLGFLCEHGFVVPRSTVEAAKWYHRASDGGVAGASYALARLYETGEGVTQSNLVALRFASIAARQGIPAAQLTLATFLLAGVGAAPDRASAMHWLKKAALAGNAEAKLLLAHMLDDVDSTDGQRESVAHLLPLAKADNPAALFLLASKLSAGEGCDKDEAGAVTAYERAAQLGSHSAAFMLSMIYAKGLLGVPIDHEKARRYLELRETLYAATKSEQ